jgi:hypothetical protein
MYIPACYARRHLSRFQLIATNSVERVLELKSMHVVLATYLFDVIGIFRLPSRCIVDKHHQQECFIANRQYLTTLKHVCVWSTIGSHICVIVPCATGHHTRSIRINQLHIMNHAVSHRQHVWNVKNFHVVPTCDTHRQCGDSEEAILVLWQGNQISVRRWQGSIQTNNTGTYLEIYFAWP